MIREPGSSGWGRVDHDEVAADVRSPHTQFFLGPEVRFGKNVVFGPNCKSVTIGAGSFIGNDVYIDVEELVIGDYFTLHHGSVIHGKVCSIGHNCWVGHYTILDAHGGFLSLGNNVGVGAHSQLWSHMKFGDTMEGCRWSSMSSLEVGDDVWFVGHCIVSPIKAARRSMLLAGGVATRDMSENRVYAGTPAKDVTDSVGPQFEKLATGVRTDRFAKLVDEFSATGADASFVKIVGLGEEWPDNPSVTGFSPEDRAYQPRYTEIEMEFMKSFLLYDRAKFCPRATG